MADSVAPFGLPEYVDMSGPDEDGVPDDLPVLPDEIYLMIAKMYRLATAKDRALDGWYRIHGEMRYLPRCPKRKRLINLKGFYVPRQGQPVGARVGVFLPKTDPDGVCQRR